MFEEERKGPTKVSSDQEAEVKMESHLRNRKLSKEGPKQRSQWRDRNHKKTPTLHTPKKVISPYFTSVSISSAEGILGSSSFMSSK